MKILVALLILPLAMAYGEELAPLSSIGVSAKEVGTSRKIIRHSETGFAIQDRNFIRQKDIEVDLRNLNRLPAKLAASVFFVARPLEGGDPFIVSHHSEDVEIAPGERKVITAAAGELNSNVTNHAGMGMRSTRGLKYAGWFVAVAMGDDLQLAGPNRSLIENKKKVKEMMDQYAAHVGVK